ncbi:MAG: hypothetical protein U0R19_11650 [Bryobacteraceae bacterium]
MPFPDDLLEQAQHLARREPKRPKQASLRRAVSTAYYALFHLLIGETVQNWKRPKERNTLARMFDHGMMKRACTAKRNELNAYFSTHPPSTPALIVQQHIHLIAETFVEKQQHRHTADYDSGTKWTRTDVNAKVNSVAAAFFSWKAIRNEPLAQNYLVTLLSRDR